MSFLPTSKHVAALRRSWVQQRSSRVERELPTKRAAASFVIILLATCLPPLVVGEEPGLSCTLSNDQPGTCAHDLRQNVTKNWTEEEPEDHAILQANYFKRLHRPSRPLSQWEADGFAFPERRAPDFEALRVDHVECEHQIPKLDGRTLTAETFREEYEAKDIPVIIKDLPEALGWAPTQEWTLEALSEAYPRLKLKVGSDDDDEDLLMEAADFVRYSRAQKDDSPLYVFDQHFADQSEGEQMLEQFSVPHLFPEDLFSVVGEDERPPYRWVLIGPKRSGSKVHTDPLGTSAWNTLLVGRKLWVLSPPGTLADLQGADKDRSEAVKYFIDYLPAIRKDLAGKTDVYVLVQHPGETIFVPGGWAHGVLNLDDTVAVTQNFVSSKNFAKVWRTTRYERAKFAVRWLQRLLAYSPTMVHNALSMDAEDEYDLYEAMVNDDEDGDLDYDEDFYGDEDEDDDEDEDSYDE